MRRGGLAALALLLIGLSSACGNASHAPGTIVFASGDGQRIYTSRPDGTGLTRLLSFNRSGAELRFNAQGTEAVVLPHYTPTFRPYLLDLPSQTRHRISVKDLQSYPAPLWSPNGEKLLAFGDRAVPVSYDVATHQSTPLNVKGEVGDSAWSPDSKSIVYTLGYRSHRPAVIFSSPVDGGAPHMLVRISRGDSPTVSADGKWVAFSRLLDHGMGLYVMRTTGRSLRRVATDPSGADAGASWSPTGERLAYATLKGTGLVDLSTGRSVFVAGRGQGYNGDPPQWSPDGGWVLFSRKAPGYSGPRDLHYRLWVMRGDGSQAHAVTHRIFPDYVDDPFDPKAAWVAATLHGTPARPAHGAK
jgi:Tol biopolymer transport system component